MDSVFELGSNTVSQTHLSELRVLRASAYGNAFTQIIAQIHNRIANIYKALEELEVNVEFAKSGDGVISCIEPTLERQAQGLHTHQDDIQTLSEHLADLEEKLQFYAAAAQVKHVNLQRDIQRYEAALLTAVKAHTEALKRKRIAQGLVAETSAQKDVDAQQKIIFDSARAILRIRVQENRGFDPSPLLEKKITDLQMQLRETAREQRAANPELAWPTNPWAREQDIQKALNRRALRSVEKLANNLAFTNLKDIKNTNDLKFNEKLLDLMNISLFALFYFNKASANSAASFPSQHDKSSIVNQAVNDVMCHDLAEIQKEADGLIGSPNPNCQFCSKVLMLLALIIEKIVWAMITYDSEFVTLGYNPARQFMGKLFMVLALAIATTVSAVLIMSMLGVTSPAFLVPYLSAIQASSMVSPVLNFVAAKLAVDLNTAAVVTAVATAGTFGLYGKFLHASGAPTSLKSDLDRAVQNMEAALSITLA